MTQDLIEDLALIACPPLPPCDFVPPEVLAGTSELRERWAEDLTDACGTTPGQDPLLVAIESAAADRDQAQQLIRHFVAYGRHIAVTRRSAAALAAAAGMDRKTLVERHVTDADVAAVRALFDPVPPSGARQPGALLAAAEEGVRGALVRDGVRHGLARLDWALHPGRTGHASGPVLVGEASRAEVADDVVRVEIAREWATHLGLAPVTVPSPHAAAWGGTVDGLAIEVWTISDSAGWDNGGDDAEEDEREHVPDPAAPNPELGATDTKESLGPT